LLSGCIGFIAQCTPRFCLNSPIPSTLKLLYARMLSGRVGRSRQMFPMPGREEFECRNGNSLVQHLAIS
jgi:hypothetical protein